MTQPLTPAQADLVAEYHDIATHAAIQAKRRWPRADFDDLRSWAFFGLIAAAQDWDPERGMTFVGYARQIVRHRIKDGWRAESHRGRRFRTEFPFDHDDDGTLDERRLAVEDPGFEEVEQAVWAAATVAGLDIPDRHRAILIEVGAGRSLLDVAAGHGVTESRVCQIRTAAREKFEGVVPERRCGLCGVRLTGAARKFCSTEHRRKWLRVRAVA